MDGEPSLPRIRVTGFFNLQTAIQGPRRAAIYYAVRDILTVNKAGTPSSSGSRARSRRSFHDIPARQLRSLDLRRRAERQRLRRLPAGVPTTQAQDSAEREDGQRLYAGLFLQDDFRIRPRL
jgi:hypothetical protein